MAILGSNLNRNEVRQRALASVVSLLIGLGLMLFKFWAYNMTRSQGVFSDAMESIVNVIAAATALLVIFYASKPADQDHPYGHGKVEYFSAAFEGGLIAFAAMMIVVEAIKTMINGHELQNLDRGMIMILIAGAANLVLGYYLIFVGKKNQSMALRASGQHVVSDFWTSVGVVVGLLLVKMTGYVWFDSLAAIMVAIYLAWTGFKLVKESVGGLLDAEDLHVLTQLVEVFSKNMGRGLIHVHNVKVIRSGHYHHIDSHIVLPEFWTTTQIHDAISEFEKKVIAAYEFGGEMNFHVDPCRKSYCRHCDLVDCPIRVEKFEKKYPVKLDDLRSTTEPAQFRPT